MKAPELLGLAIRIIGVISLFYLLGASVIFVGTGMPLVVVTKTILWALVSIWFIRGAPQLVRFAYPHSE